MAKILIEGQELICTECGFKDFTLVFRNAVTGNFLLNPEAYAKAREEKSPLLKGYQCKKCHLIWWELDPEKK